MFNTISKRIVFFLAFVLFFRAEAQTEFWGTGDGFYLTAGDFYIGASFVYPDASVDLVVSLYQVDAADTGALYFCVPGTDSLHFLFNNHGNGTNPTTINLSDLFTIPAGTEICFAYKTIGCGGGVTPADWQAALKYTGPNLSTSQYISDFENDEFGKRWAIAGRIYTPNGIPTDSVEFAFEDQKSASGKLDFNDIVFHAHGLGLNIEKPIIPSIDSAVIYDVNGDGIGDSLVVIFADTVDKATLSRITLTWPENTSPKQLNTISVSPNFPNVLIATDLAQTQIKTDGTGAVTVIFDSLGTDIQRDADVIDAIGPLLKGPAIAVERFGAGVDSFTVTFTEKVNVSDISGASFILLKGSREIIVSVIGTAKNSNGEIEVSFVADLGGESLQTGDSLKILATGPVVDKRYNHVHPDNTPVPIVFSGRSAPLSSAWYCDENGDGIVEIVKMHFAGVVNDLASITCTVQWRSPDTKGTVVQMKYGMDSTEIIADIKDIFSSVQIDRTSGTMELAVTYTSSNLQQSCTVADSAAPVLTSAVYSLSTAAAADKGFDTLTVTFSENVEDVFSQIPFDLQTVGQSQYYLKLEQLKHTDDRIVFRVHAIVGVDIPVDGDSIWIDYKENISDVKSNKQDIRDNKRIRLTVTQKPFTFIINVLGPLDPIENKIPDILLSEHTTIHNGTAIILIPSIEIPDTIVAKTQCAVEMYDAVGNTIATCKGIDDQSEILQVSIKSINGKNSIVVLWSGQNTNRRAVAAGAYLGRLLITYPDGKKSVEMVLVGVKK